MAENKPDATPWVKNRVSLDRTVRLRFHRFQTFLTEIAANISPTGMFVKSDDPCPVGEQFEFECSLADGFPLVKGRGEVVWIRHSSTSPALPNGMGVRFLELANDSENLIRCIVEERRKAGEVPFDLEEETKSPTLDFGGMPFLPSLASPDETVAIPSMSRSYVPAPPPLAPPAAAEPAPEPPSATPSPLPGDSDEERMEALPEIELEIDGEQEALPESEAGAEPEIPSEPEPEPEALPVAETRPEPASEPAPETAAEPAPEHGPAAFAEIETAAEPEPEHKPAAFAEVETRPEPEPEMETAAEPEPEPQPRAWPEPVPEPPPETWAEAEAWPEPVPEPPPASWPEPRPEPRPEPTPSSPPPTSEHSLERARAAAAALARPPSAAAAGYGRARPLWQRAASSRLLYAAVGLLLLAGVAMLLFNLGWVPAQIAQRAARPAAPGSGPGAAPVGTVAAVTPEPVAPAEIPEGLGDESAEELSAAPAAEAASGPPEAVAIDPRPERVPEVVSAWAAAWSEQRVDDYLAFYAEEFVPADGATRSAWAASRRERLLRPGAITVAVDGFDVEEESATEIRVTFTQSYRSATFSDRVRKTLRMVWDGEDWKIAEETVVAQLPA